jgi:hypothetical protein
MTSDQIFALRFHQDLDRLSPVGVRVSLEKLVKKARWLQLWEILTKAGNHHCERDTAEVPTVDRVDTPTNSPELYSFEDELKGLFVLTHCIQDVIRGDPTVEGGLVLL